MSTVSDCIRPFAPLSTGPGTAAPRTFTFADDSVTIYPKLPNGQSCRVVIIRRAVTTNHGTVFHAVRNAGRWSFRIDYAFKAKATRMPKAKFLSELTRMGGAHCLPLLFAAP